MMPGLKNSVVIYQWVKMQQSEQPVNEIIKCDGIKMAGCIAHLNKRVGLSD